MLKVSFSAAKIAECGRVDPASGWIKFHCLMGKGYEKLFERMDWQIPDDHTVRQTLDGALEGGYLVLTAKDKLIDADVQLAFKSMTGFQCLRLELEGRKGKGFRRELRFSCTFKDLDGLAKLEAYMNACDNARGVLAVSYLKEPVQETIPEPDENQLTLDPERAAATSAEND
jgi:hypothetical protein